MGDSILLRVFYELILSIMTQLVSWFSVTVTALSGIKTGDTVQIVLAGSECLVYFVSRLLLIQA